MKTWKKLLAILMTLVMVFALVACGEDKDIIKDDDSDKTSDSADKNDNKKEPTVVGEWVGSFDLSEYVYKSIEAQLEDFPEVDSELPFKLIFTFDDNGEYTFEMKIKESDFEDYLDDLADAMVEYLINYAAENNMTEEDLEAAIEDENGMSLKEYAKTSLEDSTEGVVDSFNQTKEGYFKVVDDTIYMDEDEDNLDDVEDAEESMTFKLDDETLTIKELHGEGNEEVTEMFEMMGLELPWKLEKN